MKKVFEFMKNVLTIVLVTVLVLGALVLFSNNEDVLPELPNGGEVSDTVDVENIDWSSVTYCSFGDSITAYNPVTKTTLPEFVVSNIGLRYNVNKAVGGGTFFNYGGNRHCITNAVLDTLKSFDIISIAGGINDIALDSPLGNYGDKTNETLYGCLYLMCEHANRYWKDSFVFFITPLNCKDRNCDKPSASGYSLCAVAKAMQEVCGDYGFLVLDAHHELDCDFTDSNVLYDGWHPTADYAQNTLAPYIAQFIKDNYNK